MSEGSKREGGQAGRRRNRRFAFMLALLSFSFCFLVGEIATRFIDPQPTYTFLMESVPSQYRPGGFIPFTLRPNYTTRALSAQTKERTYYAVRINNLGLRGKDLTTKKPKGTKRILVLGDSFTFGLYVNDDESYPAVLESFYEEEGRRVEVINAGFADGWSPDEHYAWLVNVGLKLEPDVIVYGFYIGNDIDWINEKGWVELDKRGLPIKIENPKLYIDDMGRIRSRVLDDRTLGYANMAIYKIPIIRNSHLLVLISQFIFGERWLKLLNIEEKKHFDFALGGSPFVLELKELSFKYRYYLEQNLEKKDMYFKRLVGGMAELSRENNIRFMVKMTPMHFQVMPRDKFPLWTGFRFRKRDYFSAFTPWLRENGIEYVDIREKMKARPGGYYPPNGEIHYNKEGHGFAAKRLKEALDKLGWI